MLAHAHDPRSIAALAERDRRGGRLKAWIRRDARAVCTLRSPVESQAAPLSVRCDMTSRDMALRDITRLELSLSALAALALGDSEAETWPPIGAVMRVYSRVIRAVSSAARATATSASARLYAASASSFCCFDTASTLTSSA